MIMAYKKGDWVRVVSNEGAPRYYTEGEICKVDDVGGTVRCVGKDAGMFDWRFEPWTPRVGERVRFVRDNSDGGAEYGAKGEVVTVKKLCCGDRLDIEVNRFDWHPGAYIKDIEPVAGKVAADEPDAPKFKVGDRVLSKAAREAGIGIVEEIKQDGTYRVNFKDTWYGVCTEYEHHIELATPTPLKIEAGKFYMTRDGRKVGPMRAAGGLFAERWKWACGQLMSPVDENGKYSCFDRESPSDLIAEAPAPDAETSMIESIGSAIVCLIRDGKPRPATAPYVHENATSAHAEAGRLASLHKGDTFGVYKLVDTLHCAKPTYDHEWQRLAAGGEKIRAIGELRRITGLGLKATKDAVEGWMQAA